MNVIALRHDAVFMNAGSYVMSPNSSACTLIWRRSTARMTVSPSVPGGRMGIAYGLPVRVSLISRVPEDSASSPALPSAPRFSAFAVVPMLRSPWFVARLPFDAPRNLLY